MNTGVYAVAETLNIDKLKKYEIIDQQSLNEYEDEVLANINSTSPFNEPLIYGDWQAGIDMTWRAFEFGTDFVDGGHVIRMAQLFGLPDSIALPLKALVGIFVVAWFITMVTGRK